MWAEKAQAKRFSTLAIQTFPKRVASRKQWVVWECCFVVRNSRDGLKQDVLQRCVHHSDDLQGKHHPGSIAFQNKAAGAPWVRRVMNGAAVQETISVPRNCSLHNSHRWPYKVPPRPLLGHHATIHIKSHRGVLVSKEAVSAVQERDSVYGHQQLGGQAGAE